MEVHRLTYTTITSDGGTSTYPIIAAENPYGPNHILKKMEYLGHVQKRMYAHLKALKSKQNKGVDGKVMRMGGKGRLTDVVMKKLQKFYGKPIRSNIGDAKSMQDAVMAIYYHSNVGDTKSMQDAVIAIYYHSNVGDAKSMQDAVMAIYYHSSVGDAKNMQDAVMAIYYHSNIGDAKSMQDAAMAIYYHSNVGDIKSMQDAVMAI